MIPCYNCDRVPEKHECGRCRLVLKHELVKAVLELDRVYLIEKNRNKHGRPSKIKDEMLRYEVAKRYKEVRSYRKVGKEFGISRGSVQKIIKGYGTLIDSVK